MQKVNSVLHFMKYRIIETQCNIDMDGLSSNDINIKLGSEVESVEEIIRSKLTVEIKNETEDIFIKATICGDFEISNIDQISEEQVEYFKKSSTVSILFPYLRSYVTFLTSDMGISPIQLPIMNVAQALKDKEPIKE